MRVSRTLRCSLANLKEFVVLPLLLPVEGRFAAGEDNEAFVEALFPGFFVTLLVPFPPSLYVVYL